MSYWVPVCFRLDIGAISYLLYLEVFRISRSIAVCRDTKTWVLRAEPHSRKGRHLSDNDESRGDQVRKG